MIAGLLILPLLLLGLIAFLIYRVVTLHRQTQSLEWRISALERALHGMNVAEAGTTGSVRPPSPASPAMRPAEATLTRQPESVQVPPPQQSTHVSKTKEEWESFVGGRLLNRIGAFALILGVGFFLKYAFDNNWISEPVRVLIGAVVGVLCLWAAQRTSKRGFAVFAQGLIGGGTAILYLSIFAAFGYYSLIPQLVAGLLMAAVTGFALFQGVRYESLAVGILGWAGGVLTPWLLTTGENSEVRLFLYLAFLAIGVLAPIVVRPRWIVLGVLAMAGTWAWYWVWHNAYYDSSALTVTLFFVLTFWALFVSADIVFARLGIPFLWERRVILVANVAAASLATMSVGSASQGGGDELVGIVLLAMALIYAGISRMNRVSDDLQNSQFTITIAATLTYVAIGYLWDDFVAIVGWSALVALLVWLSRKWSLGRLLVLAQIAAVLTAVALFQTSNALFFASIRDYSPGFNLRTLGYCGVGAGSGAAWWFVRSREDLPRTRSMFLVMAFLAGALFCTVELNDTMRLWRLDLNEDATAFRWFISVLAIGILWCSLGFLAVWGGKRFDLRPLIVCGIVLVSLGAVVGIVRGAVAPAVSLHIPLFNPRVAGLLAIAGLLAGVVHILGSLRRMYDVADAFTMILSVGVLLALFTLLTGETRDYFELRLDASYRELESAQSLSRAEAGGHPDISRLRDLQQLSISGIWLFYSVSLMAIGFWRSRRDIRIAAISLFGLSIAKIFLYDLSFLDTLYRIFSFVGLGVILLATSYAYQRYKSLLLSGGVKDPSSR